jgi:hypothetical protein
MSDQKEQHIDPIFSLQAPLPAQSREHPSAFYFRLFPPPQPGLRQQRHRSRGSTPTPSSSPQRPSGGRRRLIDDGHGAAVAR